MTKSSIGGAFSWIGEQQYNERMNQEQFDEEERSNNEDEEFEV